MISSKSQKNLTSSLALCLMVMLGTACSGGSFLGGQGSAPKPSKKATANADVTSERPSDALTSIDEILELPLDQYYVQTLLNIAATVGDDEFEVEGMQYAGVASTYLAFIEEKMEDSDTTVTLGEHLAEMDVGIVESTRDEFIEALDFLGSMGDSASGDSAELQLASGKPSLKLQGAYYPGFYYVAAPESSLRLQYSEAVSTGIPGQENASPCTTAYGVQVSGSKCGQAAALQTMTSNPVSQTPTPTPSAAASSSTPCPEAKPGYSTQARNAQGLCVSKLQIQFDKLKEDPKVGVEGACKNLSRVNETFNYQIGRCSAEDLECYNRNKNGEAIKHDNGATFVGDKSAEASIAALGAEQSDSLYKSLCK